MPSALLSPIVLAFIVLVFFLGGFVKGVIGMGLPTIAMALLTLVLPPTEAAALMIIPSFVTNVWQMARGPGLAPLVRRLWTMMAGIIAGSLAGTGFMASTETGDIVIVLGIALAAYAVLGLTRLRFSVPPRRERWLAAIAGVATGLVSAATGVFVIPAVPFLGSLGLKKDELIQALGLSFTTSTIALAIVLTKNASFHGATLAMSAVALVPVLIGMAAGGQLRGRVREHNFRRLFFIGLLLLGLYFASAAII